MYLLVTAASIIGTGLIGVGIHWVIAKAAEKMGWIS